MKAILLEDLSPSCHRCGGRMEFHRWKDGANICQRCQTEVANLKDESEEFLNSEETCTDCGDTVRMGDISIDNGGLMLCELCASWKRRPDQRRN